jgi:hypothetical protein
MLKDNESAFRGSLKPLLSEINRYFRFHGSDLAYN